MEQHTIVTAKERYSYSWLLEYLFLVFVALALWALSAAFLLPPVPSTAYETTEFDFLSSLIAAFGIISSDFVMLRVWLRFRRGVYLVLAVRSVLVILFGMLIVERITLEV